MYAVFVRTRTTNTGWDDLSSALDQVRLRWTTEPDGGLAILAGSDRLLLQVRTAAVPSVGTVDDLVAHAGGPDGHILVADRLSRAARARLRESGWGWLDRRGHLRVWSPRHGVLIETDVEPSMTPKRGYEDPLATSVGLEVAIELLLDPKGGRGVRELAVAIDRAPSSVSVALKRLREAALVTEDLEPLIPELFDEVSGYWAPKRVALAGVPVLRDQRSLARLRFDVEHPDAPGWALTDTLAAHHLGAPVIVGSGYPPDFYVPSERILRDAVDHFGLAPSYQARVCTVSVPPTPAAVVHRIDRSDGADTELLLTRPLFVALELARDRARGSEILRRWDPPEGHARVW